MTADKNKNIDLYLARPFSSAKTERHQHHPSVRYGMRDPASRMRVADNLHRRICVCVCVLQLLLSVYEVGSKNVNSQLRRVDLS